jgi:hypothetical protein
LALHTASKSYRFAVIENLSLDRVFSAIEKVTVDDLPDRRNHANEAFHAHEKNPPPSLTCRPFKKDLLKRSVCTGGQGDQMRW